MKSRKLCCKPVLLSSVIFILIAGCTVCSTKKVPCNAFSEPEFGNWFPYNTTTKKTFKNLTTGDTTTYAFNQLNSSEPYEASVGGYGGGSKSCTASIGINANGYNGRDYMSVQYQVDSPFSQAGKSYYFTIALSGGLWNAGKINAANFENAGYGAGSIITSATNVLFANGVLYQTVVTITNDTSNTEKPAVYKLIVAKQQGVIGYETYPSLQQWVIQ